MPEEHSSSGDDAPASTTLSVRPLHVLLVGAGVLGSGAAGACRCMRCCLSTTAHYHTGVCTCRRAADGVRQLQAGRQAVSNKGVHGGSDASSALTLLLLRACRRLAAEGIDTAMRRRILPHAVRRGVLAAWAWAACRCLTGPVMCSRAHTLAAAIHCPAPLPRAAQGAGRQPGADGRCCSRLLLPDGGDRPGGQRGAGRRKDSGSGVADDQATAAASSGNAAAAAGSGGGGQPAAAGRAVAGR